MSPKTHPTYVAAALAISAAGVLIAANLRTADSNGLTVHEWGTFTSVAGEDGAAVEWEVLGGKDDLPKFVNNRGFVALKWRLPGTVRLETPVLYFYSSQPLTADVKVAFPKGLITEWYPNTENQIYQKSATGAAVYQLPPNLSGIDTSMRRLIGGIEWKNVAIEPGTAPDLPLEESPSRYYAARATDAAPIAVDDQHEKFLFYRGVGRFAVPLSARLSGDGKVVLENRGADPVPMALLFENREGRLGYRIAGSVSGSVTLDRPLLDAEFAPLGKQLENTLMAQGLFPKEAQAMIETWRDSWFEEGSRIIYIVPSRTLDAVLPLQIEPVPSQSARVFVGRIELITPEIEQSVETALATNDRCVLDRYGRFLDPILKRISSDDPACASEIERFLANAGTPIASAACP